MTIIEELVAAGWRDGGRSEMNGCRQAWPGRASPLRIRLRDCELNGNPPAIVAEYIEFPLNGNIHRSVEVVLCGQRGGRWFRLRAYALAPTVAAVEDAARSLGAAWEALP